MDVGDVMVTEVATCRADESLVAALGRMDERGVSCVPVLASGTGRRLVGVLTRGAARRVVERRGRGHSLVRAGAGDAMAWPARWCWPSDTLESAVAIMSAYGVRRLPVVTPAGDLAGLISLSDVARAEGLGREGPSEMGHVAT